MSNYSVCCNINNPEFEFPTVRRCYISGNIIFSGFREFNWERSPTDGVITIIAQTEVYICANFTHTRVCINIRGCQIGRSGNGCKGTCLIQETVFGAECLNGRFGTIRAEPSAIVVIHSKSKLTS